MSLKRKPNKCNDTANKSLDGSGLTLPFMKVVRFAAPSTQSLDASCLKTQSTACLKIKKTRSAFLLKLRAVKRRGEIEDASNKSLDVSGKQRRCFLCQLACVCRHVSSVVGRFLFRKLKNEIAFLKTKTLRVKINLCEDKRRAKDNDTPNKSLDVRRNSLLHKNVAR